MKSIIEGRGLSALSLLVGLCLSGCGQAPSSPLQNKVQPASPVARDTLRLSVLREAALKYGLTRTEALEVPVDPLKERAGELLFRSPLMSFNGSISCQDCHLDAFGSGDGIPNAIGVGGTGQGLARMHSGGRILPRNARPFWGVGSKGFTSFFWDGKVEFVDRKVVSQFGDAAPSDDPMVVAVHLPPAEIREMIVDDQTLRDEFAKEDVATADRIYAAIAKRVGSDRTLGPALAKAHGKPVRDLEFIDIANSLAQFIRHRFRLQPTKLHKFVFDSGQLTQAELNGGLIFYGRGRCVACHSGPYFSDFRYHAVAFPQAGFGKNGFGIDEGRYNVTLDPQDRFLFRTPPLYNLSRTAPYSHSGSVPTIRKAIVAHFDPLGLLQIERMQARERSDLFQRLGTAARETLPSPLTDQDVSDLEAFLAALEF